MNPSVAVEQSTLPPQAAHPMPPTRLPPTDAERKAAERAAWVAEMTAHKAAQMDDFASELLAGPLVMVPAHGQGGPQ
eukprot:CAMPEP_0182881780 /NCGR_PEP_ID=MMETSP0034_2-20130328/17387_1 /TAXON_ID=156128 /ORGANISM="Nephroselmis pyriformis, Strain CCMP717" /LENGTH=76 /DNA_ID=CAMNT_0025014831 /DNA_START=429 /DNA_END=659 /DNA_ORIENTATION=+